MDLAQYDDAAVLVENTAETFELAMNVEYEFCYNNQWQPTSWFGNDAWMRVKSDVFLASPDKPMAVIIDWKTGKNRGPDGQAQLNAAAVFAHSPHVHTVVSSFRYVEAGQTRNEVFGRKQFNELLNWHYAVLSEISISYTLGDWPKKESFACKFCPVTDCEFNKSKGL
jgi:hypothetical protein